MSDVGNLPIPPNTLVERPLNKGMFTDRPGQGISKGGFLDINDYISTSEGLLRRPGFSSFANADTVTENIIDIATLWEADGDRYNLLLTDDYMHLIQPNADFTQYYWKNVTGSTMTVTGVTITGTASTWDDDGIKVGDLVAVSPSTGVWETGVISTVGSNTSLTLDSDTLTDGSYTPGTDSEIRRLFHNESGRLIDWCVGVDGLAVCSYFNEPATFNSATSEVDTLLTSYPTTGRFYANTCDYFLDRLWVGDLVDGSDGVVPFRLRWSDVNNMTSFGDLGVLDLPYHQGNMRKIKVMGDLLVVYFQDRIYVGTRSNVVNLPVVFRRVETRGRGLVGQKAVTSFINGHFFISQDDIYFLSNGGLQAIGSPVVKDTIRKCSALWRSFVVIDPVRNRVVFGFPEADEFMVKLWSFEYRSKSWSYDERDTYMVSVTKYADNTTWDSSAITTWAWDGSEAAGRTWDSFSSYSEDETFTIETEGGLRVLSEAGAEDEVSGAITASFTTRDFDLDLPDMTKTFTRIALKTRPYEAVTADIVFTVEYSVNKGRTWNTCEHPLTIDSSRDEGYTNLIATGSTIRFRFTSSSIVESYYVNEMTIRYRIRGQDASLRTQEV
jgi:hypothetical protein